VKKSLKVVIWKALVTSKKHLNQPVIEEVLSGASAGAVCSVFRISYSNFHPGSVTRERVIHFHWRRV